MGAGWRDSFLPLAAETEALYADAIAVLKAEGAEVVEDPFAGRGWVELYGERPRVGSVGTHDMLVYLARTRPGCGLLHQSRSGRSCPGGRFAADGDPAIRRRPRRPRRGTPSRHGAWRCAPSSARSSLPTNSTDSSFPRRANPSGRWSRTPSAPEYRPNNHAELPSNIINDIGLPTVTVPFAYYADGTPFVLAFIGDLWSDADLLAWAYDLEQATMARVAPRLSEGPG